MSILSYLDKVDQYYQSGHATEHTYRGDFANLVKEIAPNILITNEPSNVTDCGNPDYVITRKGIPVGFIEAKDLGKDLGSSVYKEQFSRYKKALDNLIITDYIRFQFFQRGKLVHEISIAEIESNKVNPLSDNFDKFTNLIQDFCVFVTQSIKSPKTLAEMMASKAKLLESILEKAVSTDENENNRSELQQQYDTFKDILIHDLTPKGFADIYAQTIAYGMFAARLHDHTLDTFSRQEAAALIPKSNPFLRKLFDHLAGVNIDERIVTTVDNLAEVFRATNVEELLKNFGKNTRTQDPIIHFYETFLAAYDPKLRKSRGVWYTPEPVVNFIVRGVDEILKSEFAVKDGLSDTSKTTVEIEAQGTAVSKGKAKGKRLTERKEVHRVQVLDPAAGTGTFLAEVIKFIYFNKFEGMQGAWTGYVDEHLVPRLNGFELLMASYSVAHLKLDMLLTETGYKAHNDKRFNIFLTNSLEEHHPDTGTLFSAWLSKEANEANNIKRDTPVMVVIGNPPYSGESSNKGDWIMELMDDYKKEPGGKVKLKERNSKFVNDDYVKFLRYGQHFIERNGSGVLAYINPHGYLDNPTFRGMRWNLLKTYDKIYTVDLHGNNKKKEVCPDGSPDKNVFDIEQGVSINFFIKTGAKKKGELGSVHHFDLYGKRDFKYQFLLDNSFTAIPFTKLSPFKNNYIFKPIDESRYKEYNAGINPTELFPVNVMGFQTHRDHFCIDGSRNALIDRLSSFSGSTENVSYLEGSFDVRTTSDFDIREAQVELNNSNIDEEIIQCGYRPFDTRYIYFNRAVVDRPRKELLVHSKNRENLLLGIGRQGMAVGNIDWCLVTVSKNPVDANMFRRGGVNLFPLYLYADITGQSDIDNFEERIPNLNMEIIASISKKLKLPFAQEKEDTETAFSPVDIVDYIYAILHSTNYRSKFADFLKTDFPKIPYPRSKRTFWKYVRLGSELRAIHLLESDCVNRPISNYPISGDNIISNKITSKDWELYDQKREVGRVWINEEQFFECIPLDVWNFYIGGYQPARKWLNDRSGKRLSYDDILHYQKVIAALHSTIQVMIEIEEIELR